MRPARTRAFTLIELLLVILIIAVVSAVIVPAFAGFYEKARFDAEIRRTQDYFALAHERAVKGDTNVTLHFEHGISEFSMVVDPLPPQNDLPTAMLTASGTDMSAGSDVAPYHVGSDFQIEGFTSSGVGATAAGTTGGQADVHFHGDGTSDTASFVIASRQGYTANMALSPMNGRLDQITQAGR